MILTIDSKNYYYDNNINNYRYDGSNKKLSDKQLRKIAIEKIIKHKKETQSLTDSFLNNQTTFYSWQYRTAQNIKNLHLDLYKLGLGDSSNLDDFLVIARELKNLHYKSFKKFTSDISSHELSKKQISARLNLFWRASKSSFEAGTRKRKMRSGNRYGARRLGACINHCQSCIAYQAIGIVTIEQIILPATMCECGANCCCDVVYGKTKEEVVAILAKQY